MGQINSTRNTGNHDPVREEDVTPPALSGVEERRTDSTDAGLSAGSGGRRRSIRNSIIGIVRPRVSSRSEGSEIQDVRERKKWFRRSRRLSKAQPTEERNAQGILSRETEGHQGASQRQGLRRSIPDRGIDSTSDSSPRIPSPHDIHNAQEATNGRPESNPSHGPQPSTSLKGKERLDDVSDNNTGSSEATSSNQASGSGHSSSAPRSQSTAARAPGATFQSRFDRPAASPPSDPSLPMPTQNDNVLRQFPPAGTLVVVQGVVQTDGTPRTALDNPSSLGNTMQPSPFSNRNPVQRPSLSPEADQNSSRTYSDVSSTEGPGTSASSGFSEGSMINEGRASSESSIPSGLPSSTGFRNSTQGLTSPSSSGVDVLGALLSIVSVATAATAASLLSGPNGTFRSPIPSAERPITTSNTSPTNESEGSTTSSVARALASTNPIAAAVLAQHERDREERERTRVRSIWEGFRSRVTSGRSSRGPLGSSLGSTFPSPAPPLTSGRNRMDDSPAIPDALFAELARAFNLSSSTPDERQTEAQNTSATNPNPDEDRDDLSGGRRSSDREPEDPTPDSFEQFLVDLQSDLRTALSRNDAAQNGPTAEAASGANGTGGPVNVPGESSMDVDLPESPTTDATYHTASSNNNHSLNTPSVNDTGAERTQRSPTPLNSDNGSSVTNPGQGTSTESNQSTPSTNSTAANGRSRGNGVNWWRMYRFPPMQPTQPTQVSTERRRVDSNYLRERPPTPIPSSSPPNTGASSTGEQATSEDAGTMVPVIVVGLQSISPGARRTTPLPPEFTRDVDNPLANEYTREPMGAENGFLPRGARGLHNTRAPWPSRAPSRVSRRFGRLGRREDLPADQVHDMPNAPNAPNTTGGARTFFIYVFGGHYPPNHHIFSGSDALDSFEALWELADLLGQVKPPVVTEEDIERSGLELFKAKDLGEYESSGRVANNCIDRCLICLDDYNPEDDLRLLTCKHTFHKGCVDRWLKTGRNNCPACRTEGVKTGSSSTSAPSL